MRPGILATLVFLAVFLTPQSASARDLTFEERVNAQEAVERAYYSHQLGATRPFEEAVPRSLLENKVRTYLQQSLALQRIWRITVTPSLLQSEMQRVERNSRMPGRLRGLYASLGNDPFLIQECLIRPVLVSRLVSALYASDVGLHAASRAAAEGLHRSLVRGAVNAGSPHPARTVREIRREDSRTPRFRGGLRSLEELPDEEFNHLIAGLPSRIGEIGPLEEGAEGFFMRVVLKKSPRAVRYAIFAVPKEPLPDWWGKTAATLDERLVVAAADPPGGSPAGVGLDSSGCVSDDTWATSSLGDPPLARGYHTAVWTGTQMIVWGGHDNDQFFSSGGRYDPVTDAWTPTSPLNAPSPRAFHTAVWTGNRMVVWGGWNGPNYLNSGGRYDPVADTWEPTSAIGVPLPRRSHTAVWTGGRMIIWGGTDGFPVLNGAQYDPVTDGWFPVSAVGSPNISGFAVWTGSRMLVWAPSASPGALYDPVADQWTPMGISGQPVTASLVVWTGSLMLVHTSATTPGGRYDPLSDTWSPITTAGAPNAYLPVGVWNGSRMLVWGSGSAADTTVSGSYDPAANSWGLLPVLNEPLARVRETAVWTGTEMVVWGGHRTTVSVEPIYLNSGARFRPATNSWTPMQITGAPSPRIGHSAVWTGSQMIVWGGAYFLGTPDAIFFDSGGRYDPATDSWTPVSLLNAPSPRHTAFVVWTGSQMIVWGGADSSSYLQTGGRYDPVADAWTPTSTVNAPSARYSGTAVWTGSQMLIWGGYDGATLNSGGFYNPSSDIWSATPVASAPSARAGHAAVWTGSRMLIWGGYDGLAYLGDGSLYDPSSGDWSPISSASAPSPRAYAAPVWTGSEMLVWGGFDDFQVFGTGARYAPGSDTWSSITTLDAPPARDSHTSVWTGQSMVIWGGGGDAGPLDSGGRYNPASDSWNAIPLPGSPLPRRDHSAVWSGDQMIVWGGFNGSYYLYLNTGGLYCTCGVSATFYRDEDSDGYGNDALPLAACHAPPGYVTAPGDCNDSDGDLWDTPGEAIGVHFTDAATLAWSPPLTPGGSLVRYDLLRTGIASDFVSSAVCLLTNEIATGQADVDVPAVSGVFHYLVRARNDCAEGNGPLGTASNGQPRIGRSCP